MKYSQDKHEIPLKVRTLISSSSTLADGTADGYGPRKLYARAESRGADARSAHPAGPGPDQPARGPTQVRTGHRSEERRVGTEYVSTCRSRWSQYHSIRKE